MLAFVLALSPITNFASIPTVPTPPPGIHSIDELVVWLLVISGVPTVLVGAGWLLYKLREGGAFDRKDS